MGVPFDRAIMAYADFNGFIAIDKKRTISCFRTPRARAFPRSVNLDKSLMTPTPKKAQAGNVASCSFDAAGTLGRDDCLT
jgi:hypothetical protein